MLRMPLLGTGRPGDPIRVELPTYTMIEVNYAARWALVEVPESDLLPSWDDQLKLRGRSDLRKARPMWPLADVLARWHAHLDDRYQEHRGRFRPIPD